MFLLGGVKRKIANYVANFDVHVSAVEYSIKDI